VRLDVNSALNKIRFITERALHELCQRDGVASGNAEPTLERMVGPLTAAGSIPKPVALHVRTIQGYTSPGSHFQPSPLSEAHAALTCQALVEFLQWYWELTAPESRSGSRRRRRRTPGTKKKGADRSRESG
jgi:hypothetical protein